jgi:AcrR family transcriptional regulator
MSISYERTGRTQQKARTRDALIAATRRLLAQGTTPTVEQAAAAAQISRATAYRYFPNQRTLLAATYPLTELRSLLPTPAPPDPAARLAAVADAQTQLVLELEPELRTQLRLALDPDAPDRGQLPLRRGRRIIWIQEALAPLRGRLPDRELQRLVHAIGAVVGIEALVWLTDIAGLPRQQAVEVMRWSARTLLRAAVAHAAQQARCPPAPGKAVTAGSQPDPRNTP